MSTGKITTKATREKIWAVYLDGKRVGVITSGNLGFVYRPDGSWMTSSPFPTFAACVRSLHDDPEPASKTRCPY